MDTETGGLDPSVDSILTLGAVIWNDGGIEDTLELTIAEPEIHAHPEALKVNGLDVEKVRAEGLSPLAAVFALENFLQKNDLRARVEWAAHNKPFDDGFLRRLYRLAGRDYSKAFSHRGLCTQVISYFLMLSGRIDPKNTSLDSMCGYFSIGRGDGAHHALADAVAAAQLLTKLTQFVNKGAGCLMETPPQGTSSSPIPSCTDSVETSS